MGWSGQAKRNPNSNVLSRVVIPKALHIHDYTRPYLPSSPFIDNEAYESGGNTSEDHLWGPRDYFKGRFYGESVCHFASETGYHACPSPESVKRFIPKEYLFTSKDSKTFEGIENPMWLYHSSCPDIGEDAPWTYRIRLMSDQVTTLFGHTVPNNLSDFAKASQISQAEAKKYFIERFRISKWRRTGIIWWNLIDGWPQFSDAIVDYYGVKKLAYHYVTRSQMPLCLMFDEPKDGKITLYAVNDKQKDTGILYTVKDVATGEILLDGSGVACANASVALADLEISAEEKRFLLIEWKSDEGNFSNHYTTNIIDINYPEYLSYIRSSGYEKFEGFED
jgi:beta-mannosidase